MSKGVKKKFTEWYNKISNNYIKINDYDFYKHFNYHLFIKELEKLEIDIETSKNIIINDYCNNNPKLNINNDLYNKLNEIYNDIIKNEDWYNILSKYNPKIFNNTDFLNKIKIYKNIKSFMEGIHEFRSRYFLILFQSILNTMLCNSTKKDICKINNFGSIGLSSDYDISIDNITNEHDHNIIIDIIFNYCLIYNENLYINNAFDINFYFTQWGEEYLNDSIINDDVLKDQLIWSYNRIKKNKIDDTNLKNLSFVDKEEITDTKDNFINKIIPFTDLTTTINKALYDNYNNLLKVLINERDKNKNNISYYNLNSKIAYLENDTYYSCGAYTHVVKLLQGDFSPGDGINKIKEILQYKNIKEYFKMSFFENLGFLLVINDYKNYKENGDILTEKDIKYIFRCYNALTLYNSGINKSDIYKSVINKSDTELLNFIYSINIESIQSIKMLENSAFLLNTNIITYIIKINVIYANKKKKIQLSNRRASISGDSSRIIYRDTFENDLLELDNLIKEIDNLIKELNNKNTNIDATNNYKKNIIDDLLQFIPILNNNV